jgi:chromosome partitioning protein
MKANTSSSKDIQQFFEKIEQQPVAVISERSAYGQLAMQGLSIFDRSQKNFLLLQTQWQPLLDTLIEDPAEWF